MSLASDASARPRLGFLAFMGLALLRALALVSLGKGLWHWAVICGFAGDPSAAFADLPSAQQTAVVYFAVIDVVAGVGLWLAALWGGVLWLLAVLSLVVGELLLPEVFGGRLEVAIGAAGQIAVFLLAVVLYQRRPEPAAR